MHGVLSSSVIIYHSSEVLGPYFCYSFYLVSCSRLVPDVPNNGRDFQLLSQR